MRGTSFEIDSANTERLVINVFADGRCRGRAHRELSLFCNQPFATHPLDIRYELLGISIAGIFELFGDSASLDSMRNLFFFSMQSEKFIKEISLNSSI